MTDWLEGISEERDRREADMEVARARAQASIDNVWTSIIQLFEEALEFLGKEGKPGVNYRTRQEPATGAFYEKIVLQHKSPWQRSSEWLLVFELSINASHLRYDYEPYFPHKGAWSGDMRKDLLLSEFSDEWLKREMRQSIRKHLGL